MTPSPLAAAAEALLKSRTTCCDCVGRGVDWRGVDGDLIAALRAALASDAAWRARAEAAVEQCEAQRHQKATSTALMEDSDESLKVRMKRNLDAADRLSAARRRYEEAARG